MTNRMTFVNDFSQLDIANSSVISRFAEHRIESILDDLIVVMYIKIELYGLTQKFVRSFFEGLSGFRFTVSFCKTCSQYTFS